MRLRANYRALTYKQTCACVWANIRGCLRVNTLLRASKHRLACKHERAQKCESDGAQIKVSNANVVAFSDSVAFRCQSRWRQSQLELTLNRAIVRVCSRNNLRAFARVSGWLLSLLSYILAYNIYSVYLMNCWTASWWGRARIGQWVTLPLVTWLVLKRRYFSLNLPLDSPQYTRPCWPVRLRFPYRLLPQNVLPSVLPCGNHHRIEFVSTVILSRGRSFSLFIARGLWSVNLYILFSETNPIIWKWFGLSLRRSLDYFFSITDNQIGTRKWVQNIPR